MNDGEEADASDSGIGTVQNGFFAGGLIYRRSAPYAKWKENETPEAGDSGDRRTVPWMGGRFQKGEADFIEFSDDGAPIGANLAQAGNQLADDLRGTGGLTRKVGMQAQGETADGRSTKMGNDSTFF